MVTPSRLAIHLLVPLAAAQLAGATLGWDGLQWIGRVTAASPAPIGFSHKRGIEPFASRIRLDIETMEGARLERPLDRAFFARLPGPLGRRLSYTAALFYAVPTEHAREVALLERGLCRGGPLAAALQIGEPIRRVHLHATPRTAGAHPWTIELTCVAP